MKNITGGIVEKTMPIQVSNVALYNAATGKADRAGFKVQNDGIKVRVFKSSGELVSTKA
jgi:large subunit ribosomal protein L24